MRMASNMIFAMRTAPGQDRANPVPEQKLDKTQNVLRGALYMGCLILMLCEMVCRCSSVIGLPLRLQAMAPSM